MTPTPAGTNSTPRFCNRKPDVRDISSEIPPRHTNIAYSRDEADDSTRHRKTAHLDDALTYQLQHNQNEYRGHWSSPFSPRSEQVIGTVHAGYAPNRSLVAVYDADL